MNCVIECFRFALEAIFRCDDHKGFGLIPAWLDLKENFLTVKFKRLYEQRLRETSGKLVRLFIIYLVVMRLCPLGIYALWVFMPFGYDRAVFTRGECLEHLKSTSCQI